jgi:F0F1-type ATP synthase epsilon subunit
MATIKVDVVSAEEQIFSGQAKFVALPGEAGELGILRCVSKLKTAKKSLCSSPAASSKSSRAQ